MDQRRFMVVDGERNAPMPHRLSFSLLRLSAPARLALAAVMVLALWDVVLGIVAQP